MSGFGLPQRIINDVDVSQTRDQRRPLYCNHEAGCFTAEMGNEISAFFAKSGRNFGNIFSIKLSINSMSTYVLLHRTLIIEIE